VVIVCTLDSVFVCVCVLVCVCQEEDGDYTYVERLRIPLTHGTLLMMEGATQDDWQVSPANQIQGHTLTTPSTGNCQNKGN
jgi:hypothetical protein